MKIQFVLVEPRVPENIGASARALKTMGFESLVLVNPCSWKEGKSKWVAHGSSEILDNARVYDSLEGAISESDLSVATSAKQRSVMQDYIEITELYDFILKKNRAAGNISIVFGREESGLTNDEIKLCDITSSIPMVSPYPSLNLSQAVMLYAYELSGLNSEKNILPADLSVQGSFRELKSRIRIILSSLGIDEHDNRYGRIMERLAFLGNDDINLMHSVTSLLLDYHGNTKTRKKNK